MKQTSDILHDWQKTGRLFPGYKKGEVKFVILKSRGTGKSMMMQNMIRFSSSWTDWKPQWTWKPKVSSRSGKLIWGRIMTRTSKYVISGGKLLQQRASPKEAYAQQKEAFKRALS